MDNQKWNVTIDDRGRVKFPPDLWQLLKQKSGIRSKKYRLIKKGVKRVFTQAIRDMLDKKD